MKRKLAAVLCADAAGYCLLMGQDEARTLATLKAHFQVMRSIIDKFRGRVMTIHGDNLLAEFASVVDAVQCAVDIQNELKARNEELPEASRMLFRIGINLKILTALQVNLTVGEQARVWAEGTRSLDAYLRLMRGREYLLEGNRESAALARRMAEEAIALDPGYADAYALLGATHMNDVWFGTSRPKESIAKAIELSKKALGMNGSLSDARSRLGMLYSWSGRYDEGIAEAERGVELDPNSGRANYFLAQVLRYAGRSKEAVPVMRKALRLEPVAPDIYVQSLALIYFQAGDCKEAIATCDKGLQREPDNLNSRVIRAAVFGFCGREAEAREEAAEVLRINPKFTVESYTGILPYKYQSSKDLTIRGLRRAGLP